MTGPKPDKPAARKRERKRLDFIVQRAFVVDQVTGEMSREAVGVLVPLHKVDRRTMRDRSYHIGRELSCMDMRMRRNSKFYRLAHVLGAFLSDYVEGFAGVGAHEALKLLQTLSGVGVAIVEYDLPGLGKLTRTEAASLNFETMDEAEFAALWDGGAAANNEGGWIGWLRMHKWPELARPTVEEAEAIILGEN